jgi:uncharacterized membrane protein
MKGEIKMADDLNRMSAADVTSDDRLWAALSWVFWPIAVLALIMEEKKARPFVRYHAVHSLIAGILFTVIASVTAGCGTPIFVIALWFAYKSYQGEWSNLPIVTDFAKKQGWV